MMHTWNAFSVTMVGAQFILCIILAILAFRIR